MRRARTFALVLLPLLFSGCKGLGALFRVLAVAAYVGVRVAAVAATSAHHTSSSERSEPSSESTRQTRAAESSAGPTNTTETTHCLCPYVEHGVLSCAAQDVCQLSCEEGWVYRDGTCVPGERPERIDNYP